jgi:hypothetical protein
MCSAKANVRFGPIADIAAFLFLLSLALLFYQFRYALIYLSAFYVLRVFFRLDVRNGRFCLGWRRRTGRSSGTARMTAWSLSQDRNRRHS